jgi:hypothetical protein
MRTHLYTVVFIYSEELLLPMPCHFKGFSRVIVYSVFGVGAEIEIP